MEINEKLLIELQNRLKVGNRRGVHLNAIPARSKYKFDLARLSQIDENIPKNFVDSLLTVLPLKFKISWKDNVPDLNCLEEDNKIQLSNITKSFENLINQTDAIESEKGINTFGFGFPLLVRRDQTDNKLTVAPILIWSLRIKRTKEFNTWEILRTEDDPIYINEVLINHLQSDSNIEIDKISSEFLDDGLIDKNELLDICVNITKSINSSIPDNLRETFEEKLNKIKSIPDKKYYEKLPLTSNNSFIDFGGLFSIFEVQKQNIIHDYTNLLELKGAEIKLEDFEEHTFQPISSVETDPSQQGILHSLKSSRNILIQGPPGTGKSQSLTAILVNALENKKKTIVVCEKRTALEVLYNSLNEKGLNYQCVLLKDIIKDRKLAVDSVRERVDSSSYRRYTYTHSKETLDNIIDKSRNLIDSINTQHKKIGKNIIGHKNWTSTVGSLLLELKNNSEDYKLEIAKDTFSYESSELNILLELIRKGQNLYTEFKPFIDLSFLTPSKLIGDNPFIIEQQIKDDFSNYMKEFEIIIEKTKEYHQEYYEIRKNEINNEIKETKRLIFNFKTIYNSISQFIEYTRIEFNKIRNNEFQNEISKIQDKISEVNSIFQKYSSNAVFLDEEKTNSLNFKVRSIFSKDLTNLKKDKKLAIERINEIESILIGCKDLPKIEFGDTIKEKKINFYSYIKSLEKTTSIINDEIHKEFIALEFNSFNNEKINLQTCFKKLGDINSIQSDELKNLFSETTSKLIELQESLTSQSSEILNFINLSNNLTSINSSDSLESINLNLENYSAYLDKFNTEFSEIINNEILNLDILGSFEENLETQKLEIIVEAYKKLITKINHDNWSKIRIQGKKQQTINTEITKIIEIKDEFFNNENDLFSIEFKWNQFYNSLSVENKLLIDQLKGKTNWRKTFMIFYLDTLLINSANTNLPTDDKDHIELDKSLHDLKSEQIKYIKEYWFSKQIDATREFDRIHPKLAVENLYNKRSGKRHKRLSLREIVKLDMDLFTTFFPIILATPDVVSNIFKGHNEYFDIVMFDEASQLKLEDNLPALLKGKQIIIAGDEHQMPPSNYFSKIFDGAIDDEDEFEDEIDKIKNNIETSLLDCESLLDFASELGFEKKYLDFHYRSKHPYLIDFSNYAFYNKRLKPLPNDTEYIPIKYVPVDGTYSDNSNDSEAETVLSIIDNNISRFKNGKYPTVGIATFNINQRNLILEKINKRRKSEEYRDFNEKIVELEENGFFVKNLENIQGDEKDVIILSTTYGINKDGKFAQRFGSINHQKGYKLLNVIITRAKYKVYACTSIPEDVFLNYKEHLNIEGSNNRKGALYAYLAYAKAVSEEDNEARLSVLNSLAENSPVTNSIDNSNEDLESPFEEEVYQVLTEHFDENNIIPQLQYAGFRIDMVYDSKRFGVPKIAIECDGATYHSSQEAYLHDRHRQKILEAHGFIFHRIWSTNWWRNQRKETEKLVDFINNIETKHSSIFENEQQTELAFTDNIKIIENELSLVSPSLQIDIKEAIAAVRKR